MTSQPLPEKKNLEEILSKVNFSELPAFKEHRRDLLELLKSSQATAHEIVRSISKDIGLTVTVLKEVNSAYYTSKMEVMVPSIAAAKLGFGSIRDLATSLTCLEDLVDIGLEQEGIKELCGQSILSAVFAQNICLEKKLYVQPEEAYVCTLLHQLGKLAVLVHLPYVTRDINQMMQDGASEDDATMAVFNNMTFEHLGMEIARIWNFPEKIITSMDRSPSIPRGVNDVEGYLKNVSCFANNFVKSIISGQGVNQLLDHFGDCFNIVNRYDAFGILEKSVDEARGFSKAIRLIINGLKVKSKLSLLKSSSAGAERKKTSATSHEYHRNEEETTFSGKDETTFSSATEHTRTKSLSDYVQTLNKVIAAGNFDAGRFVDALLRGLHKGIGFDRAIIAYLDFRSDDMYLTGRYGVGDLDQEKIKAFEHPLSNPGHLITQCIIERKDMEVSAQSNADEFPDNIAALTGDRFLYLLPICLNDQPTAMLYLDRKSTRPPLTKAQLKDARVFRDILARAMQKNEAMQNV